MAERKALEQHWRNRLADAKLRLDFARNYLAEVRRDLPSGEIPQADGDFAFQRAVRAETFALVKYKRVLRIYADLIVHGWIPDEAELRDDPSEPIRHAPGTAHFRCPCGTRLVFSDDQGRFLLLRNLKKTASEKTGQCPRCQLWHSVEYLPRGSE